MIFGLLACALSAFFISPAIAEIRYGQFTLLPEVVLQEAFRSNIYQTQFDAKSDFVTTITPGIGLRYLFGRNSLALDYKVGFVNFAHYSTNNYQDHRANGLLNLVTPGGLEFTFGDNFIRSTQERTGTTSEQLSFQQNLSKGIAAYRFADTWKLEAKYLRDDFRYDSSLYRDSDYTSNLVGMSLYYRVLPRLSGLIEFDYVMKNFPSSNLYDHSDRLLYAGVAFDPGGKLKGSFRAGYGWENFDTRVPGRDNQRTWVMAAQLVQDFSSKTSLTLDALRAFADDPLSQNAPYINTLVSVNFQHFFTGKIAGVGTISYQETNYLDYQTEPVTNVIKKRTDRIWGLGVGGVYNIQKWLQTRLEYSYLKRDSNFFLDSFDEHRIIFRIVLSL